MNPVIKKFKYGQSDVTIETGRVARQATGSVLVTVDDIVVLVAVTAAKEASPGQGFFPLSVHYQERQYAVGKIPGGYIKRETRPSEKETLTSRLIDRPIRPLFPNGFLNEVQVVCQVISANKTDDADIAAMIGTSAALAISGVPFNGPIGAARVSGSIAPPAHARRSQSRRLRGVAAVPVPPTHGREHFRPYAPANSGSFLETGPPHPPDCDRRNTDCGRTRF